MLCDRDLFFGTLWHGSGLRGSGTSVFTGFEGRVRHTLASHSGPSGNTPLDGVSPFRKRCRGCGNNVFIRFEGWMKHTSRGSGPSVFNGFEGRVRHTLASHSGPSGNTPLDGFSPFRKRCRGCGNSVFIGFEGWVKQTTRGSGPSVFNGFEGRVRHTLASHSAPSGNTPLDGVSPFRKRCRGCGNSVFIGFEGWVKHTTRGSGPSVFITGSKVGLGTPWRRIRDLPETRH